MKKNANIKHMMISFAFLKEMLAQNNIKHVNYIMKKLQVKIEIIV